MPMIEHYHADDFVVIYIEEMVEADVKMDRTNSKNTGHKKQSAFVSSIIKTITKPS